MLVLEVSWFFISLAAHVKFFVMSPDFIQVLLRPFALRNFNGSGLMLPCFLAAANLAGCGCWPLVQPLLRRLGRSAGCKSKLKCSFLPLRRSKQRKRKDGAAYWMRTERMASPLATCCHSHERFHARRHGARGTQASKASRRTRGKQEGRGDRRHGYSAGYRRMMWP